jgi:hypothetical protein
VREPKGYPRVSAQFPTALLTALCVRVEIPMLLHPQQNTKRGTEAWIWLWACIISRRQRKLPAKTTGEFERDKFSLGSTARSLKEDL